jgi:hypothetical protein
MKTKQRRGVRRLVVRIDLSQCVGREGKKLIEMDCGHLKLIGLKEPVKVGDKNRCVRCLGCGG